MLSITLKSSEIDLLRNLVESAPRDRPYSIAEVRRGVDLLRKMDEAKAANSEEALLLLEKAEHEFIKARLDQPQWLRAGTDILDLFDKVQNAQDVKVQPAPKTNGAAHEGQTAQ